MSQRTQYSRACKPTTFKGLIEQEEEYARQTGQSFDDDDNDSEYVESEHPSDDEDDNFGIEEGEEEEDD